LGRGAIPDTIPDVMVFLCKILLAVLSGFLMWSLL